MINSPSLTTKSRRLSWRITGGTLFSMTMGLCHDDQAQDIHIIRHSHLLEFLDAA